MTQPKPLPDFDLEVFFSKWEFQARHHMTASDVESRTVAAVLELASDTDRDAFLSMRLGYTQTWGEPELRAEIASTYESAGAGDVLCLAGAGEGLYAVARSLLTADDHVVTPTPNYQSAESVPLSICDVTGVPLVYADGRWRLEVDAVAAAVRPNTKLLSLNFPNNPTGLTPPREDLEALVAFCRPRGIYILSDEVYRGVELDLATRAPQMADLYERGISLNVMSKAYGLPGLRIGWIASRDTAALQAVERYKHYLSICNAGPAEQLALIALRARDKILAENRALLLENVLLLEQLIADHPGIIEWRRPDGGCVAYPRYTGPDDVERFCAALLEEDGVLLLPASIYASDLGETPPDHFRIGFGRGETFKTGVAAMRAHFQRRYADFAA